ncbi:MAG: hypothetical protein KF805_03075 [Phycisphaeraceae bacterium]|nr:hypothetical protein [Phycisphaeraceae bacterium]
MNSKSLFAMVLAAGAASAVFAGQIQISNIGGGLVLNSGPLGGIAFPNAPSTWGLSSVASIHASLNASGVSTNGKITFVAADTDQGLAFMALIDQQFLEGPTALGNVHMDSVTNGANLAYMKDTAGNLTVSAVGPNSRIASGNFAWNSNGGGDAFAWAGLSDGNSMTFRFNSIMGEVLGLNDPSTFQFVTWTGTNWALAAVSADLLSFSDTNDFGFAATAVPAPGVFAIAGAPLLGLSMIRRRRAR